MTANINAMLRAGREAYQAGNKLEARTLLEKVLELDEYNEMAWLLLSGVVETPEEKRTCLENVLVINPNNDRAKQGIKSLGLDAAPPPPPAVKTGTGPFSTGIVDDFEDDPPTASSSASSSRSVKERPANDYDQWISGLGIGGSPAPKEPPPPALPDEPFGSDAFGDRLDDLFGDDDFDSPPPAPAPAVVRKSSPAASPPPAAVPDEDDYGDEDEYDYGNPFVEEAEEVDFETAVSQDINRSDALELFETDMFDEEEAEEAAPDPTEFFKLIPKEIKPTRLPGEPKSYPKPLIAGIVVLVVLNLGALVFLMTQLG